ncbi:MAG: hypothetical protein S4CHLAM81_00430 [Chlamydiales bacterium]|nr:hypothetical protein [Chlamydiales bacterium]MCH9634845.1 hypothetical protein [Chlamydiales bacterium]
MRRLLLLLLIFPLFGFSIKEKLADAEKGNWVVTSQGKGATFFFIRGKKRNKLTIEEVSIPISRAPHDWKNWFESGAPGHTLWTSSLLDIQSGQLEESFSFTHSGWIDQQEANAFFSTLLNLSFNEVPDDERKKVGYAPKYGQKDRRRLWQPPLVVEGQREADVHFDAYKTRWPNDRSDLAKRKIEVYFTDQSFFPHWIEVDGKIATVQMHVIDSGKKARSPKPKMPQRKPQISGPIIQDADGITIPLNSPSYFTEFLVLAEDADDYYQRPIALDSSFNGGSLFIPDESLHELNGSYHFLISPKEEPKCLVTTHNPFAINKSANS